MFLDRFLQQPILQLTLVVIACRPNEIAVVVSLAWIFLHPTIIRVFMPRLTLYIGLHPSRNELGGIDPVLLQGVDISLVLGSVGDGIDVQRVDGCRTIL